MVRIPPRLVLRQILTFPQASTLYIYAGPYPCPSTSALVLSNPWGIQVRIIRYFVAISMSTTSAKARKELDPTTATFSPSWGLLNLPIISLYRCHNWMLCGRSPQERPRYHILRLHKIYSPAARSQLHRVSHQYRYHLPALISPIFLFMLVSRPFGHVSNDPDHYRTMCPSALAEYILCRMRCPTFGIRKVFVNPAPCWFSLEGGFISNRDLMNRS